MDAQTDARSIDAGKALKFGEAPMRAAGPSYSYLRSSNADYIDELFARYLADPTSVDETWRFFFEGLELGEADSTAGIAVSNGHAAPAPAAAGVDLGAEARVIDLIQTYRARGRLLAAVNPLAAPPSSHPALELSAFGLSTSDLTRSFQAGKLLGLGAAPLSAILARLKAVYCGSVGVETAHLENTEARDWLLARLERDSPALETETRRFVLDRLIAAESLERFLHTRYVAQKRFSVEGGEAAIPALDAIIETAAGAGVRDVVLGMAHRGRLNVLVNIFGKKPEKLFTEFEGTYPSDLALGEGDVKYHKGASRDFVTRQGAAVHLSLAFNPSHLEFVNAVVEGAARAKQDRLGLAPAEARARVLPILIHGDAALAGQGVCYEVVQMCGLEGYSTGGTLHLVINNQVGFTTSPRDSRSTPHATDLARMLDAPIFHVNGDDPEAVWRVARLAAEYRQRFQADVFIDLVCYRKHGHNEGDEPSFTQPLMYKKIKAMPSPREAYSARLVEEGVLGAEEARQLVERELERLSAAQKVAKETAPYAATSVFEAAWSGLREPHAGELLAEVDTRVDAATLRALAEKLNRMPAGFQLHPKLARFFEARAKAVLEGAGIDWGNAETLAYATLLREGHSVRLAGQDAERGTFTHRHSVVTDPETGQRHVPLNQLGEGEAGSPPGRFQVYNSHLSETGAMGFEYGYAITDPRSLVIWEAQFGDFANGAQVIIDQFIATSESKWRRMNGLVLLLPHGYEGQGPEHSSARLERFLSLCGRDNLIVCNLSTPAQIFHALRRQLKREFRKPLVVMSPKSLLRLPQAVSTLDDLTQRSFQEVIDDPTTASATEASKVRKILLCSGKVYYDLVNERVARKRADVAIVRVEQLYPWPAAALARVLARYSGLQEVAWVQEEPRNMGAWQHVFATWMGALGDPAQDEFFRRLGGKSLSYAGRPIASSPAVGSPKAHEAQLKELLEAAFT